MGKLVGLESFNTAKPLPLRLKLDADCAICKRALEWNYQDGTLGHWEPDCLEGGKTYRVEIDTHGYLKVSEA